MGFQHSRVEAVEGSRLSRWRRWQPGRPGEAGVRVSKVGSGDSLIPGVGLGRPFFPSGQTSALPARWCSSPRASAAPAEALGSVQSFVPIPSKARCRLQQYWFSGDVYVPQIPARTETI